MYAQNWQRFLIISVAYIAGLALIFSFNRPIFYAINGFYSGIFQYPMLFLTAMADGVFVVVIGTIFIDKNPRKFLIFILSLVTVSILVNSIKSVFSTGRPPYYAENKGIFILGEYFTKRSFPSGHSAAIMTLARFLTYNKPLGFSIPIIVVCVLAAVSRVYVGAHYPIDIFVGGGVGFFLADFYYRTFDEYEALRRKQIEHLPLLMYPVSMGVAVYFIMDVSRDYQPLAGLLNVIAGLLIVYFGWRLGMTIINRKKSS